MKLSYFAAISSVVVSSSALDLRAASCHGSVYVMSNEPTGNYIISHDIMSDGTIKFAQATYAGGLGYKDFTAPSGDFVALFSAGAVEVSGNHLFAVNAGSNTASMFAIDQSNPSKLTMVGTPVDVGGDFPVSLDISPTTGNVCVLSAGTRNGVQCFTADSKHGLRVIPNTLRSLNIPQTNPPLGPTNTVSQVLFSQDGTRLTVAVKGDKSTVSSGYLASLDVEKDGSLSQTFIKSIPAAGGFDPFGMTNIPGHDAILSTDPGFDAGPGYLIYDFSKSINATSKTYTIAGQSDACWAIFSPKTKSCYISDRVTSMVTELKVNNDLTASTIEQYQQTPGSALLDLGLASLGNEDYLYVLAANDTSIDVLKLNAPGKAQHVQRYNVDNSARVGVVVSPGNIGGIATFVKP